MARLCEFPGYRSRARPVGDTARRSVGNRKECHTWHDYASSPDTGAGRAQWAIQPGGASGIARSTTCGTTMRVPRIPKPGAPSGRYSPAERRESQGVPHLARLCEFPGYRSRARPVGDTARRSVGNRKECHTWHDYASSPDTEAGRAQWAKQPGGASGIARSATPGTTMRVPRIPEPGAPSGRSSPAERRESQGVPPVARLCEFPGYRSRARPVGEAARRSVGNRKECHTWHDYASSPDTGAGRAQWAKQPGGASGIARSATCGTTMRVPRIPKPGAPSGRSSPAERRESQGVPHLARLCEFPGYRSRARPVGDTARRSVGNRKECHTWHDYASSPDTGAGRAQWAIQPGGASGIARSATCGTTMRVPRIPEPGAPSGRYSPAERRESQGVPHLARLCEFPGIMSLRRVWAAAQRFSSRSDQKM